ncbi:glycosyltransferase family 1 protein [Agrococcus lahaulensis]|nr:glycosyltransferase family 1 protein [Agrococcus lahaulensis]
MKTTQGALWIMPQVEALLDRGAEVAVIAPQGEGRLIAALGALSLHRDGLTLHQVKWDFSFGPRLATVRGLLRLRRLLRSLQVDVVLYHLYATALGVRIAGTRLGLRRVHMVAGPLYLESPLIRAMERVLVRIDDKLIAGSEFTRRAYVGIGAAQDRLLTIPYGVDLERFAPRSERRASARAELGLPDDAFVAVMVAYVYGPKRLTFADRGIKGHFELLQAWKGFRSDHPEARLVLVGGGFDASGEALRRRLVSELGAPLGALGVTWLDSVEDVRDAYSAADLSVSPSLSENHGAALEASAMGVPSVVSDAGGLPEAVTDESGWIVAKGSVADLRRGLNLAHDAWAAGGLAERGAAARALMERAFGVRETAQRVADVVMGAAR